MNTAQKTFPAAESSNGNFGDTLLGTKSSHVRWSTMEASLLWCGCDTATLSSDQLDSYEWLYGKSSPFY